MEELQNLIKFLKNKGLKDQKIPLDVWVGIIEYFARKQETKQCDIPVVVWQSEQLKAYSKFMFDKINNGDEMGFDDWVYEFLSL